jgi:Zn-dependent protease with chaperone function
MLYVLFMVLAMAYNFKRFKKERFAFLTSLIDAKSTAHREMILGHHFYIFIFEGFLALVVAHLLTEKAMQIGILGFGIVYLALFFTGLYLYQFFIRYVERHTNLELLKSFKIHLIKELRVNFSMIMLPILIYSLINWTFQDSVYKDWGSLWFVGLLFNIIFVSVLTIACSVILMLRLIPNREITEPEYLEIINHRLKQINQPNMRIRWIESDIKNAFVVGLKLLRFSNQTMFIGRSLRTTLNMEEFDAVIAHELAHVANRHIHKRVIDLLKNFLSVIIGVTLLMLVIFGTSFLYWGEESYLYSSSTTLWCVFICLGWMFFNYFLLFDNIRSHEYEADAYAVIELGTSFSGLKSALEKLTIPDELPDYLQKIKKNKVERGAIAKWIRRNFSSHPEISQRISFLQYKINAGLPFNYYVSTPKKIGRWLGHLTHWKCAVPITASFIVTISWLGWKLKIGNQDIDFIASATSQQIMRNKKIEKRINARPQLIGPGLMYFIVRKNDDKLIDYYLARGASKGKTLVYISQLKNYDLLNKYYTRYQNDLNDDDYYLVLRKTAQLNFTEGYRLLVNAKRFEDLNPNYKESLSRLHQSNRKPAFTQKK